MLKKCLYCYKKLDTGDFHENCSLSFFGLKQAPVIPYSIHEMEVLAKNVIERSIAVPGVQAKLSMSLIKETRERSDNRLTVVGALGGNFILKPPSPDFPEMPENEHLTMRMAEAYGIRVVQSSLIRLQSGELSYITKRVDRAVAGDKIHMLDMFQITEAFDKYRSSYEKIGKALGEHSSNPQLDRLFYFELLLFCFVAGNNDMHLKNFSMIESLPGWVLSPAYDLLNVTILNPDDKEELALTLEGKKSKIKREHFIHLGQDMGLTGRQMEGVFKRLDVNYSKAISWINDSFLSREMKEKYQELLLDRYKRLDLPK